MKKSKQLSTDGFIPRNHSKDQNSRIINSQKGSSDIGNDLKTVVMQSNPAKKSTGYGSSYFGSLSKDEPIIDKPKKKLSRRQRRLMAQKMANKPRRRLIFRIIKWLLIIILIAGLSFGAYTAYKIVSASNHVFQGNIIDIFNNKPLKADKNGRSNFLIVGTSDDDAWHINTNEGAELTDSIMVVSLSQETKDVYMFSVPRDLYVQYDDIGNNKTKKINAYYSSVGEAKDTQKEQYQLESTKNFIGSIFGIDIQYAVKVNYTVLKQVVDAVGGVDVYIEGSGGASGILDRQNDWRCNFECFYVKYDNGVHHLDGEHALYLALARGAGVDNLPTYGLPRSNFDREVNQQKILIAIRDKAMSTGLIYNLGSINSIIESVGNNLRTTINIGEISTLLRIASEVNNDNIKRISLTDELLVRDGVKIDSEDVVIPSAGLYEYSEIQSFFAKTLSNNPVVKEEAPVVILNGTEKAGFAQEKKNELVELGYSISYIGDAPSGVYEKTRIYQIGTENTGTAEALSKLFGSEISTEKLPITVNGNVRFLVILGDDLVAE